MSESKLEWLGSFLIGAPIGGLFILGSEGVITWPIVFFGVFVFCALGVAAFPYITKFVTLDK